MESAQLLSHMVFSFSVFSLVSRILQSTIILLSHSPTKQRWGSWGGGGGI